MSDVRERILETLKEAFPEYLLEPDDLVVDRLAALLQRDEAQVVAFGVMDEGGVVTRAQVNGLVAEDECDDFSRTLRPGVLVPLTAGPPAKRATVWPKRPLTYADTPAPEPETIHSICPVTGWESRPEGTHLCWVCDGFHEILLDEMRKDRRARPPAAERDRQREEERDHAFLEDGEAHFGVTEGQEIYVARGTGSGTHEIIGTGDTISGAIADAILKEGAGDERV
jgi:hypothetical protein